MRKPASELSGREAYSLLIDSIVPRPVAWVTSVSRDGAVNLAPFSFFSGVSTRPPIVSLAIASKPSADSGGVRTFVPKDTTRNIAQSGEYIIHLAAANLESQVLRSAEDHPPGTDVPALLGLETVPGDWVGVPRLVAAPIAMECRMETIIEVGDPSTYLLLGEVIGWHVDDALVDEDGRIWADRWRPLTRLGVDGFGGGRSASPDVPKDGSLTRHPGEDKYLK
jgi:flavin reductase (DIM6/NTAB) family NADH-FMN oxidoreductase RutF